MTKHEKTLFKSIKTGMLLSIGASPDPADTIMVTAIDGTEYTKEQVLSNIHQGTKIGVGIMKGLLSVWLEPTVEEEPVLE